MYRVISFESSIGKTYFNPACPKIQRPPSRTKPLFIPRRARRRRSAERLLTPLPRLRGQGLGADGRDAFLPQCRLHPDIRAARVPEQILVDAEFAGGFELRVELRGAVVGLQGKRLQPGAQFAARRFFQFFHRVAKRNVQNRVGVGIRVFDAVLALVVMRTGRPSGKGSPSPE